MRRGCGGRCSAMWGRPAAFDDYYQAVVAVGLPRDALDEQIDYVAGER